MFVLFMNIILLLTVFTNAKVNIGSSVGSVASNFATLEDPFADLDDVFEDQLVHITSNIDTTALKGSMRFVVVFFLDIATVSVLIFGAHRFYNEKCCAACDDSVAASDFAPLIEAAHIGDEKTWRQLLLQAPSIVLTEDIWGCTALHVAAQEGFTALMQDLIQHGAAVDATDIQAETPLHVAARAGQQDAIKVLLDTGAHIDAVSEEGHTPLLVAAHANKADACELLLDFGATVGEQSLSEEELPRLLEQLLVRRIA